jgi:hypothetical protein
VEDYVQKEDTLKRAVAETTTWKSWRESLEVFKETSYISKPLLKNISHNS